MYKILIIGHSGYPKGIHDALNLIVGEHDNVSHKILSEESDHDVLQDDIKKFLDENEHAIIFADLTGGAPHKIAARAIMGAKKKTHFVVSGAGLSLLMQIVLMTPSPDTNPVDVKAFLENSLVDSMNFAKVMCV